MRQHNLKVTGSLQINGESVVSASQIVGLESASIHNGNWTASVENNEFKVVNDGSNLLYITSGSTEINNGTVTITADSFASDYAEDYTELGDALLFVVYHNERHLQQIKNLIEHRAFPTN